MHVNNTVRRILPTKFTTYYRLPRFTFIYIATGLKYIVILNNQYYIAPVAIVVVVVLFSHMCLCAAEHVVIRRYKVK